MLAAKHLHAGADSAKKYKIGATFSTSGIAAIMSGSLPGVVPATTTSAANALGLTVDTATYSTTKGDAEGLITVVYSPDLVLEALMSGGAANGTALAKLVNTAASTAATVVTATNVPSASFVGGILYCLSGANVSQSRFITAEVASTSLTVTVPFTNTIAVGDVFLAVPYADFGSGVASFAGIRAIQFTTSLDQADASIASGTGARVVVEELLMDKEDNSKVHFLLIDHVYGVDTI